MKYQKLTEQDIKYLRDCVLSSTLLEHDVKMGSNVLRKLDNMLHKLILNKQKNDYGKNNRNVKGNETKS